MEKSKDGTVCQTRTYPLDKDFVPFPFCWATFALFCIAVISWLLSAKISLVNQSFIIMLTVVI